jgi:hypothetical protein
VKAKLVAQLAAREGVTARADEMARTASDQLVPTEFSDTGWGRGDFETAVRSSILSKALAEKRFPDDRRRRGRDPGLLPSPPGRLPGDLERDGSRFADAARQAGATDVLTSQAVDQASPLPAAILTAIGAMTSHPVSAPVPVPKGYWVINTDDLSSVAPQSFESARASIRDHLADQERQQRFGAWLQRPVSRTKEAVPWP